MGKPISRPQKRSSLLFFSMVALLFLLPHQVKAVEKVFTNSLGMTFVLIPEGAFIMGSPLNEPHRDGDERQHQVTISRPFYMQTTEVTVEEWRGLMGERFFVQPKGDNVPITGVSWRDIMEFIEGLNTRKEGIYRLPTEAEWEYASRAWSSSPYSWGNTIDCRKAMYSNSTGISDECVKYFTAIGLANDQPSPVKSYPPNAWGLYDMHGNAWEWVMDWYNSYPESTVIDPGGPEKGSYKVRRGGSWFVSGHMVRSANRDASFPASRYKTTGFRIVREAP